MANSVKRFERSNGLDTALYKNYLYLLSRLWTLLQFTDMNLSLFAICLRFPGFCLGMRYHCVRVETDVEN